MLAVDLSGGRRAVDAKAGRGAGQPASSTAARTKGGQSARNMQLAAQLSSKLFSLNSDASRRVQQARARNAEGKAARGAPTPRRTPYDLTGGAKPVIVVDGPNVAMRHGKGKLFSCMGIQLAIVYYQKLGHSVFVCLPEGCLDSERVASLSRAAKVRPVVRDGIVS